MNANFGISYEGISVGGGIENTQETSTTMSKEIEFSIPPGRQAVYVAGVAHRSQTGNVQVNYGSRQKGHFVVSTALLRAFLPTCARVAHAAWLGLWFLCTAPVVHRCDGHEAHARPRGRPFRCVRERVRYVFARALEPAPSCC